LADDYPDELAFRSSLAALLNNQALALVEAGRHEDALAIYERAVESQQACLAQSPKSAMFRDLLSKIYYNHRQALQLLGRMDEAAQTALARRELWRGNGQRLFGVGVELAGISRAVHNPRSSSDPSWADLDGEVVATLRQVHEDGWPPEIDLATDERFAYLHGQTAFEALLMEVKSDPPGTRREQLAGSRSPAVND
jgi:tetratricopeptide (TPR) repeat protein